MSMGKKITIEIGKKYNMLTVIGEGDRTKSKKIRCLCRCECGNEKMVIVSDLTIGKTKSCGCLRRTIKTNFKHGYKPVGSSKLYTCWTNMKKRCTNDKLPGWKNYGGRGITYDPRWEKFENFLEDMGEPVDEKFTLDRIDNDGNYCKENCRWADRKTQTRNSRHVRIININGESLPLIDAVAKYGKVSYGLTCARICEGWEELEAILTPKLNRWGQEV